MYPEIGMGFVLQATGESALLDGARASNRNAIPGFKGKHKLYMNKDSVY